MCNQFKIIMKEKLIPAPIDNENISEEYLEDKVFRDFYQARDHRNNGRHLVGRLYVDTYDKDGIYIDGYVDVKWNWGDNKVCVELIACPASEDFSSMSNDFAKYYTKLFKEVNFAIKAEQCENKIYVSFFCRDDK